MLHFYPAKTLSAEERKVMVIKTLIYGVQTYNIKEHYLTNNVIIFSKINAT